MELRPIKNGKKKSEYFGVADIEANRWTDFVVQGFYTKRWNKEKQEDEGYFKYFRNHKDFFDFLFSKQNPCDVIYAHYGGGYDFMFWLKHVLDDTEYVIDDMIGRGSKLLCMNVSKITRCTEKELPEKLSKWKIIRGRKKIIGYKDDEGNAVWCSEKKIPKKTRRSRLILSRGDVVGYKSQVIKFKDSTAMLPFKLDHLTKSFDVTHKKLKYDFNKGVKFSDELVEYLEYDCKGLYEVIEKYREWPLVQKAGTAPTMAGQALRVFRTFLDEPIRDLSERQDDFIRKSYFGGRTEIFKPLYLPKEKNPQLLKCADVNSLYPTVMEANDFPIAVKERVKEFVPGEMGFYHVRVSVPKDMYIPPLGTYGQFKRGTKYIFPVGEFDGHWSSIELEYAMSLGVRILKVYSGYTMFNGGPIFRDYINTLYRMRLDAKANKDGVGDILCKLLMNSLYGRFGLAREKEEIRFERFETGERFHSEIITKQGITRLVTRDKKLSNTFTNVGIASWVTALARIHMHKEYVQHQKGLYYTDTDSMFTLENFVSGGGLGELAEEYACDSACFLLPKTYLINSPDKIFNVVDEKGETTLTDKKVVAKGFDRYGITDWTIHDFIHALEGSMKMMAKGEYTGKNNMLEAQQRAKFATFRASILKGEFLTMLDASVKGVKSCYDKRRIIKTGGVYDTVPLIMKNSKLVS